MAAHRIVDGVYIHLMAPQGFVDAASVFPTFMEIYQREQDVLAVYLEACPAGYHCDHELPDPFVEVLVPERTSPLRRIDSTFFEACKLEVEGSIRGLGVGPQDAHPARKRPLPPLATFTDGPGWFSCCTLRYKEECPPLRLWEGMGKAERQDAPAESRAGGDALDHPPLVPCLTGNIIFVVRDLPVIINIHRSVDHHRPKESFEWMQQTTAAYRRELLPLNGVAV